MLGLGLDCVAMKDTILVFKQRQTELQTVRKEERKEWALTVSSYVCYPLECLVFGLRYVYLNLS